MHLQSMYPAAPPASDGNAHHILFPTRDRPTWPDFTRFIDASTGKRYSDHEFLESVCDGATALGTPASEGGLGLRAEDGEIVGILSDNCVVSVFYALSAPADNRDCVLGIYDTSACIAGNCRALLTVVVIRHTIRARVFPQPV